MIKKLIILCCLVVSKLRANIILGIDLGSDYFKMNVLKPGRPFTMVENIQSKTATHTGLGFKDDERLYGPETLIRKVRFPKQALNFIDRFLGEQFGATTLDQYMRDHFVSYDMEEDENRRTFNFKLKYRGEDYFLNPEEHFGMLFRFMKLLTEKFVGAKVYDAVVAVPSSWGYKKRNGLSQAVRLAGLELKGIVTQNTAAAVHWMNDKSFNETAYYIFYNMGSSYTQATLVSLYSRYTTDSKNKTTEFREVTVLGETWDEELGGRDFDFKLVKMLMELHDDSDQKKGKPSIKDDYRVAEKILPSAIKYKEILSSNKQVDVNILGVESGINLKTFVQKADYEERCKDLIAKVVQPVEKLLALTGLTKENITAVELIGGGIRVPKVKDALDDFFGSSIVGVHMNGDDSVAFGTAYIYANMTKHFKVAKRVYANSGPAYEIKINIDSFTGKTNHIQLCPAGENNETAAFECTRRVAKNTTLFKIRHGADVTRTVTFKHDSDMQIKVYENKEGSSLMENYQEPLLMTFFVTGFDEVKLGLKSDNVTVIPKTHLRFRSNEAGLISLTAEVTYDVDMYFTRIKGENNTEEFKYVNHYVESLTEEEIQNELETLTAEGKNETEKSSYQTKIKNIGSVKKSERKINLLVEREFTFPKPMNKTEFEAAKKKLDTIDDWEKEREKNMEARNTLETDIYAKKEFIDTTDAKTYAKESELEEIAGVLKNVSEWYDEEGFSANTTALVSKHNEIKHLVTPIERRIKNHEKRTAAFDEMEKELEKIKNDAEKLVKQKDWLESHYKEVFSFEYLKIETWYSEKKSEQNEKPLHEEPVVHHDTIHSKIKILKKEYIKLRDIPKPKPITEDKEKEKTEPTDQNTKKDDEAARKKEMEDLISKLKGSGAGGQGYENLSDEDKLKFQEMFKNFDNLKKNIGDDVAEHNEEKNKKTNNDNEADSTETPDEKVEAKTVDL